MCRASFFYTGGKGAAGSRSKCLSSHEAKRYSPGEHSRGLRDEDGSRDRTQEPGQSAYAKSTQGSFPDLRGVTEGGGIQHRREMHNVCPPRCRDTQTVTRGRHHPFFYQGRPKSAQQLHDSAVAARRAQSVTVPSSRVTRECCSPGWVGASPI